MLARTADNLFWLARYMERADFIARTIEQAKRDGYVTSLLGRRRPVRDVCDVSAGQRHE